MNDYFRCFIIFCGYISFFFPAFGLEAATYDGEFRRISVERVNPSSVDFRATSVFSGPNLVPKTFNLPITLSSARLVSLAKGVLRGGLYGMMVQAAMESSSWVWDDIMKNWKKFINGGSGSSFDTIYSCENPGYGCESITAQGVCVKPGHTFIETRKDPARSCQPVGCPEADGYYSIRFCGEGSCTFYNPLHEKNFTVTTVNGLCFKALAPNSTTTVWATDQQVFDLAVKPNSTSIVPHITNGLPDILHTPYSTLSKPSNVVNIHIPEIVKTLNTVINNINNNINVQDAIDKAVKDGVSSLTAEQQKAIADNNVDLNTLIDALNKLADPATANSLTDAQKQAVKHISDLQLNSNSNLTSNTAVSPVEPSTTPIEVNIPKDCDLIPFVCNWLTWFKGWMTEPPPPIPNASVPIKDLDGFNLWSTDTSGSCPSPNSIVVFGKTVQISYQPFCDLAVLIAPLLVALGWFYAAYIVLRV